MIARLGDLYGVDRTSLGLAVAIFTALVLAATYRWAKDRWDDYL